MYEIDFDNSSGEGYRDKIFLYNLAIDSFKSEIATVVDIF